MSCFLWKGLNCEDLNELKEMLGEVISKQKNEELYRNGYLGILQKGSAKIFCVSETGNGLPVRKLKEGDIFGAASLFGEWDAECSHIVSAEVSSVYYISQDDFKTILRRFPQVSENYITYLSDRIRFLNRRINTFTAGNTEMIIMEFLYSNCDSDGVFELNFKISEFARRLNIGRTSLYRSIESLEEKGIIKRNKNVFIVNK